MLSKFCFKNSQITLKIKMMKNNIFGMFRKVNSKKLCLFQTFKILHYKYITILGS